MPTLAFHLNNPCVVCGCRLSGLTVGTYRINKNSLIAARGALVAAIGRCPECGHNNGRGFPERWRPAPDSQQVIDAHRARKGWA